jgi:DNA primase
MYFPQEIIDGIKAENLLVGEIARRTVLKRFDTLLYGCCPFHKESQPSLMVDTKSQTFYCFGCGVGGNVIDFAMKINDCSFVEAVTMLAKKTELVLPSPEMTKTQQARDRILQANRVAADFYKSALTSKSNPGIQYFNTRGLSPEIIEKFQLGYAGNFGNELYTKLLHEGFSPEEMINAELVGRGKKTYYDKFWERVMFPILDEAGQCVAFGGRCLGDAKPKYLNSPETIAYSKRQNLFGLHIAKNKAPQEGIILAEGYMDVIALHQAGFENAVASLGTALTSQQAKLIKRYTDTVFIAYDGDAAGVKAAIRAIPILAAVGIKTQIIKMPGAKDPDEFIKKFGMEKFKERISKAEPSSRFYIQNSENKIEDAVSLLLNL